MRWPLFVLLFAAGCGGGAAPPTEAPLAPAATASISAARPLETPSGPLSLAQAEQYMLGLINRDRAAQGLAAVRWDDAAAKAARRHAEDLTVHGVTAHIGTDGSVPEQRYTAAGGHHLVMENAGCLADATKRLTEPAPRFSAASLERVHRSFMDEVPPRDGHRRNILAPRHTAVGVGVFQPQGHDIACVVQEFVDDHGDYEPLPSSAKLRSKVRVAGRVRAPVKIRGVGLSRVDTPRPKTPRELMKTGGYPIPAPYVTYFSAGYKTPIVLDVDKAETGFSIEVPLDDRARPGLYGVSVWATFPGSKELVMISLRTIQVDR